MTQKDPGGDVIEDIEGQRLIDLIEESGSMAVYFCKSNHIHSKSTDLSKSFKLKKKSNTLLKKNTDDEITNDAHIKLILK